MNDPLWLAFWLAVLGAGLAVVVVARRMGLSTTHARDLLHVGAGVWVLGWPAWREPALPMLLTLLAAVGVSLVPLLSPRVRLAGRFKASVSDGDERFAGIIHYTLAFAALTWAGLTVAPFPAAAALLSLSLGDGIGGAVGRRWGKRRYRFSWSKEKSLEGSLTVAAAASAGALFAAHWFGASITPPEAAALGLVAAFTEAAAPRSTDNVLVPAAVWLAATAIT